MKKFISKLLISVMVIAFATNFADAKTFVSLSPALTEIMYAIGADADLVGVSTECNYPAEVKQKTKVGNAYYMNKEKILSLHPDYVLLADGVASASQKLDKIGTKPLIYKMNSVNSIYDTILALGQMTGNVENSKKVVADLKSQVSATKTTHPKKILYLIQLNPLISIGNKSFISDMIKVSGQKSVTSDLTAFYPAVSAEYILKLNPDVIVVSTKSDDKLLKKLFPNTKIIYLTKEQNDLVNRPATRIDKAVKFFAEL